MNKPHALAAAEKVFHYARTLGSQLLWSQSLDKPYRGSICDLQGRDLRAAQDRWLKWHDQKTGGIPGFFPCVLDSPVRFTQTISKAEKVVKYRRGVLKGWCLHDVDVQRVQGLQELELVLLHFPRYLVVDVEGAQVLGRDGSMTNRFLVKPGTSSFYIDEDECNGVRRLVFPLVPDFSATIHCIAGRTLERGIGDLRGALRAPSASEAMQGYIVLSRFCKAEGCLLAQAFNPALFQQGPQFGPQLLLRVLRRQVVPADVERLWAEHEQAAANLRRRKWEDASWLCSSCGEMFTATALARSKGSLVLQDIYMDILQGGAMRRCGVCAPAAEAACQNEGRGPPATNVKVCSRCNEALTPHCSKRQFTVPCI